MSPVRQIEERAADWLMRREEPDWTPESEAALTAWLEESLAHKAAFWRLEYGWRRADRIAAIGTNPSRLQAPASGRGALRVGLLAASLAAAVGIGVWSLPDAHSVGTVLSTNVGEHTVSALSDGSRVELNTGSAVRTRIHQDGREVWLDRGEAYFEVAHDRNRPFVVHAGDTRITVLGTKFAVRREGDRVTVGVVEGRVKVEDAANARDRASIITAGDIALTQGRSVLLAPRSEQRVEAGLAWREGRISFDSATLGEAAREFNRYNRRQIAVSGDLAGLRIGGSFLARNLDGFVRMLRDAYGLTVTQTPEGYTISS